MVERSRRAAVITVSDGVTHGTRQDESGEAAEEILRRGRVRCGRSDRRARRAAGDRTSVARAGRGPRPGGDDRGHRVRAARRHARSHEGRDRTRSAGLGGADARRRAGAHADGSAQPCGRRERRHHVDRQPSGESERRSREPDGGHGCPAARRGPARGIDGRASNGSHSQGSDDVRSVRSRDGDDHRGQADRCAPLPGRGADRDRPRRPARGHARVCGVRRGGRAGGRATRWTPTRWPHTPRCSITTSATSRCSSSLIRRRRCS